MSGQHSLAILTHNISHPTGQSNTLQLFQANESSEDQVFLISSLLLARTSSGVELFRKPAVSPERGRQISLPLGFFYFRQHSSPLIISAFMLYLLIFIYLFGCTWSQLWHVGSSDLTRGQTWALPALRWWSLSHWITREMLCYIFHVFFILSLFMSVRK